MSIIPVFVNDKIGGTAVNRLPDPDAVGIISIADIRCRRINADQAVFVIKDVRDILTVAAFSCGIAVGVVSINAPRCRPGFREQAVIGVIGVTGDACLGIGTPLTS